MSLEDIRSPPENIRDRGKRIRVASEDRIRLEGLVGESHAHSLKIVHAILQGRQLMNVNSISDDTTIAVDPREHEWISSIDADTYGHALHMVMRTIEAREEIDLRTKNNYMPQI
jgi:hypothetical protein